MMKNYVDAMADALVDVLKYSDSSVEWPDIDDLQYDEAIKPEWFYPALQSEGESELMAILQYTQMAGLYDEEIGDLVLGVGLVEMKHFANVRDVVIKLKGTIPQPLNTKKLELGKNAGEALVISIKNEILTIQFLRIGPREDRLSVEKCKNHPANARQTDCRREPAPEALLPATCQNETDARR